MHPQAQPPVSFLAMMIDTPKAETLKLIYWQLTLTVELSSFAFLAGFCSKFLFLINSRVFVCIRG